MLVCRGTAEQKLPASTKERTLLVKGNALNPHSRPTGLPSFPPRPPLASALVGVGSVGFQGARPRDARDEGTRLLEEKGLLPWRASSHSLIPLTCVNKLGFSLECSIELCPTS